MKCVVVLIVGGEVELVGSTLVGG